jgi:FkbM family methyltransferase
MFKNSFNKFSELSFSQYGEDVVIRKIFNEFKIYKPSYIDIGTNHPVALNNTFHFYLKGSRGILIEPDISYNHLIKKYRKDDQLFNVGIGPKKDELTFFIMSMPVLNTFSQEEAENYVEKGYQIKEKRKVNIETLEYIISQTNIGKPNFISLDVEGFEMEILNSINFETIRPNVFCIEVYSYAKGKKENEITDFMKSKNYFVYADINLNSIFVDRESWSIK